VAATVDTKIQYTTDNYLRLTINSTLRYGTAQMISHVAIRLTADRSSRFLPLSPPPLPPSLFSLPFPRPFSSSFSSLLFLCLPYTSLNSALYQLNQLPTAQSPPTYLLISSLLLLLVLVLGQELAEGVGQAQQQEALTPH
jgi:hypothetical protein